VYVCACITGEISWLLGNAEQLPVVDESYDVYTVAFGIRNMTHVDTVSVLHMHSSLSLSVCLSVTSAFCHCYCTYGSLAADH